MIITKKQLDNLLHRTIMLAWAEGRTWYDKKYTVAEMDKLENDIKTFVLERINK